MGVTLSVLIILAGAALMTAGGFLLLGPAALVAAGAVLVVTGLTVDWEALSDKPAPPSP